MPSRAQSVTVQYIAWDTANNVGKTGDVANHTLRWVKDGTSAAPTNSASEVDATNAPGVYKITLTSSEATCDVGTICGKSSTSGVVILPLTISFEQLPTAAAGSANGLLRMSSGSSGDVAVLSTRISCSVGVDGIGSASISSDAYTAIAATSLGTVRTGTAQAGGSTSITLDSGASSTNDLYTGQIVRTTSGTGAGQARIITAYNGSTKVATVDRAWAANPDNTTVFAVLAQGPGHLLETLVARLTSTRANNLDNLNVSLSTINGNVNDIETIVTSTGVAIADGSLTAAKFGSACLTAAKFAAGALDANALATDAVAEIAAGVRDVNNTSPAANSVGAAINTAATAGDPLGVAVPGSYASGTAGYVLGNLATGSAPTAEANAAAVWNALTASYVATGSFGALMGTDSASLTTLLSRLTSTRAGYLDNLTNLDAAVSTRSTYAGGDTSGTTTLLTLLTPTRAGYLDNLSGGAVATASALATVNGNVNDIETIVGSTGVVVAAASKTGYELTSGERNSIANTILGYNLASVTGAASRSLLNAIRFLRNKWSISGSTLTVTTEDDATTAWTATVAREDAGTTGVKTVDPA